MRKMAAFLAATFVPAKNQAFRPSRRKNFVFTSQVLQAKLAPLRFGTAPQGLQSFAGKENPKIIVFTNYL